MSKINANVDNIQNMGTHIMLDFHNVEKVDLSDEKKIQSIFESALKLTDCNVCDKRVKVFPDGQVSLIFLLSESHMSFHSWPSEKCATVDFYNCGQNSRFNCRTVEEQLCNAFGWECCTSNIIMNRGTEAKLITNDYSHKTDIFKGLRAITRVRSRFQDIRVYDSKYLGRVLVIDGQVQMCNGLPDNYSNDMTDTILNKDTEYENVLIIGGGDLKIAHKLYNEYPKVKKITLCEIDPIVMEITEQYFPELQLTEEMKQRIEIINIDGSEFLKQSGDLKYDGVIVDCSDVCGDDSLSCSLFTNDFYKRLLSALKPGASFSQMLTIDEVKPQFISMIENSGFECNIDFVITQTPEYGSCTPIGVVTLPKTLRSQRN
ncbi:hypothetical protein ABPG72_011336 [Tetrahymena utriculariae]